MKERERKQLKESKNCKKEVKKGRRNKMEKRKNWNKSNRKKSYTKFWMKIGSKEATMKNKKSGK